MKVLGLCSFPVESAATRFRMIQYIEPLAARGITLDVRPFLDSEQYKKFYSEPNALKKIGGLASQVARRIGDAISARSYDLVFVQREAMFFGPAFFEWLSRSVSGRPLVLDLDDPTYLPYISPSYGKLGSMLKFFGKTDSVIKQSAAVVCGNRFIAEHVEGLGTRSHVIPTIVDNDVFRPKEKSEGLPTIGWIGTHSTFPFLQSKFDVLQRLADRHDFVLRIVGAGTDRIELAGVNIDNIEWKLENEVENFRSLDIGVYPITTSASADERWIAAKSGFKAIQYLAVGVPFVMDPVGVCAEIGEPGITHFNARSDEEWFTALDRLLADRDLRRQMGDAARDHSLRHYSFAEHATMLADALSAAGA